MKFSAILFVFLLSLSKFALAQNVTKYINYFPNAVQVQIYNYSEKDVRCNGFINVTRNSGLMTSHYYSETIYRGMSSFRIFNNFNFQDPYRYGFDSINCYSY